MELFSSEHKKQIFIVVLFLSFLQQSVKAFADDEGEDLSSKVRSSVWNKNAPWRDIQDTQTALNNPDRYAWQLFVALNWPADRQRCRADRYKQLGDEGMATWQTWPSRENTFLSGAKKPKSWRRACRDGASFSLPQNAFSTVDDETVNLSKVHYGYIRKNALYSLDQQERLAQAGVKDLSFPLGAKSIKAYWVEISEADKPRYHWAETQRDGHTVIYGMTGLHIISKDNPTWFWSTFEHVDNEHIWPDIYPQAFRGWQVPSKDSIACPAEEL